MAGKAYSHDGNSNLTSDGTPTYSYDAGNRLIGVSGPGLSASLQYDPNGRLHRTKVNAGVTQFLYGGDALIAEYDNSGILTRRFVHGDQVDEPWMQFNGSSTALADTQYLINNYQGSVIAQAGNDGILKQALAYDVYGIAANGNPERFGYTGQIYLKGLDLYYYKARMYSPTLGRFLQVDPIGYKDQMNLYAYVGNDPVNMVDPSGKSGVIPNMGQMRAQAYSSQRTQQSMRATLHAEEQKAKDVLGLIGDAADASAITAIAVGRVEIAGPL